jgi:predicted dehydrogenase
MGRMHGSVYQTVEGATLVACHDRKPDKAAEYAGRFGCEACPSIEDLIERCDIVDVCLPTDLHCPVTVGALQAGRHVLCEKPMALSLEEADRMVESARASGKYLMIGHCIRFWPEYAHLRDLVAGGRLGRLLSLNLTRYGEFPSWSADGWLADESRAGGGVLDMHIHDTDYAHWLLGEPDEVRSWGTVDERGASHAFTTMRFGRTVVHLEGGWNLPPGTPFKMAFRAVFEQGAAIMDGGPMTVYEAGKDPLTPQFPTMRAEGGGNLSDLGGYYHEIAYFLDCVRDGTPPETVTPESSRRSLATVLEEIRQIKAGR